MNALVYVDVDQGLNKVKLISLEHFKLSVAINRTYTVRECGPHAHCADRTPHSKIKKVHTRTVNNTVLFTTY